MHMRSWQDLRKLIGRFYWLEQPLLWSDGVPSLTFNELKIRPARITASETAPWLVAWTHDRFCTRDPADLGVRCGSTMDTVGQRPLRVPSVTLIRCVFDLRLVCSISWWSRSGETLTGSEKDWSSQKSSKTQALRHPNQDMFRLPPPFPSTQRSKWGFLD